MNRFIVQPESEGATVDEGFVVGGPVGDFELLLCHGTVCVVGRMRDLILQLSKSLIYSTKPLETIDAVAATIGSKKTAIRLAPFGRLQGMQGFPDEEDTWLTLAAELNSREIAYVHLSDQASLGAQAIPEGFLRKFRQIYKGTLIMAGGFSKEKAEQYLHEGFADLIAFGQPFIANPDLVDRLKNDWPLAIADRNTYYSGGDEGYIDYLPHRIES